MNERQKEQYKREWLKVHSVYERQAYRIYKNALDKQIKQVIQSINEDGLTTAMALLPITVDDKTMAEAYRKVYELIGVKHGKWVTDWMTELEKPAKAKIPNYSQKLVAFGSEFWRRKMREFLALYGAEKVSEVDTTTIERIRRLLVQYQTQGLSVIDQARAMVKDLANSDYNKNRSLVISRTETTTSANYTTLTAGREANYVTVKQWLAIEDNRTRPSHAQADGQEVGLNEFFIVGGSQMEYPGDIRGGANQVVNCRCATLIVPQLDEDGLPIRIR